MTARISLKEWRWALLWASIVIAVTCLPYLYAWLAAPEGLVFGGLLTNPLDGNSYLAKMRQGFEGEWRFHLPFTPEPHPGTFVYIHYLALGHLGRALNFSLPLLYHLARVFSSFLLLLAIYWFIAHFVDENNLTHRRTIFLLVAFSSGLGWLAAAFNLITADLWVPEAITFYTLLSNPHFPLSMTLMLLIIALTATENYWSRAKPWPLFIVLAISSFLLAVIQPFVAVPVYAALGAYIILLTIRDRRLPRKLIARTLIGGLATLAPIFYGLIVFSTNSALAAWSSQNLTPSPPLWNLALSYGLVLLLALPGAVMAARCSRNIDLLLLAWIAATIILIYAPLALQRRMITGLHFPLCFLAARGLQWLVKRWPARRRLLTGSAIGLSAITNLFLLLGALAAVRSGDSRLFLYREEMPALAWLREHAPTEAVVLAAPETGLFIPVWAGRRVVYGHPFETIQAEEKESQVRSFFVSPARHEQLLTSFNIEYVFFGPRERALGGWITKSDWPVAYQNDGVVIFQVP